MEAKRILEGCQIATLANTGGNIITKGFFGQIFHGAISLRFLFQKKKNSNEMHSILIEMDFMVVPYLLKTRGYSHSVAVQDDCHIIFPKQEYHAKRYDWKKWFTVASMD